MVSHVICLSLPQCLAHSISGMSVLLGSFLWHLSACMCSSFDFAPVPNFMVLVLFRSGRRRRRVSSRLFQLFSRVSLSPYCKSHAPIERPSFIEFIGTIAFTQHHKCFFVLYLSFFMYFLEI